MRRPSALWDLQSAVDDGIHRRRRGREPGERVRRLWLLGLARHGCGNDAGFLEIARQWANIVDTVDGPEFADLLNADLDLAARDRFAYQFAGDLPELVLDLFGDAKAFKKLGGNINAAGAFGVADRPGIQQCRFQRVGGTDIRFGVAGTNPTPTPETATSTFEAAVKTPFLTRPSRDGLIMIRISTGSPP